MVKEAKPSGSSKPFDDGGCRQVNHPPPDCGNFTASAKKLLL